MRHSLLTHAMQRFLLQLRDGEDQYALEEKGQCWIDDTRYSMQTFNRLLMLCAIKEEGYASVGCNIYVPAECGARMLVDVKYVPLGTARSV